VSERSTGSAGWFLLTILLSIRRSVDDYVAKATGIGMNIGGMGRLVKELILTKQWKIFAKENGEEVVEEWGKFLQRISDF